MLCRYETELKNKIAQKMIPNKTEAQILLQHFKYYDLEGQGFCNLRSFIKTHERLGVVLSKLKDIEEIFNHFDHDCSGRINYKQFCNEIFYPHQQHQQQQSVYNKSFTQQYQTNNNNSFVNILNEQLISKGGSLALMQLIKEMQIIDYNNSNKIAIDDFIKVLRECGITLHQNDYQILFSNYDLFINGILYYNELIKQLLLLFWNTNRETFSKEIYNKTKGTLGIKELKHLLPQYNRFIDYFAFVYKSYKECSPLNLLELTSFVKYFSYGIENDDELFHLLSPLGVTTTTASSQQVNNESINNNNKSVHSLNENFAVDLTPQCVYGSRNRKEESKDIIDKVISALEKINRRTLFSFIKYFRYYEDDFQCVSKYDFLKIIKDYKIELTLKDVEMLFNEKAQDVQKTRIQYDKLFKEIISRTMTDNKIQQVKLIYDQIQQMSVEYNCDELTIDFIKQVYKSKNNILNPDESNCKIEFDECIELFHFCYKGYKRYKFTQEEFIEFYSFISILLSDDNDFITMIHNEFIPRYGNKNNNNNSNINKNSNQQNEKQCQHQHISHLSSDIRTNPIQYENESIQHRQPSHQLKTNEIIDNNKQQVQLQHKPLSSLNVIENKLIKRGIRGLIYLHKQFLNSCKDLNHINLDAFINVLQLQHIFLTKEEYSFIYNQFQTQDQSFDFFAFIRSFKHELNEFKLQVVENAFTLLDVNQNEQIDIDYIKMNYIGENHPDVLEGKKNCEEVVLEFYDAFELNYLLLAKEQFVNFEIFANYYEYVAFVYRDDELFERVVKAEWGI